jgi:hypothetical protein
VLVNRILHHVHFNASFNSNQYGFIPQSETVEAAMAVNEIIGENLKHKHCISIVSLDVRGAFDAAWWPSILLNLKELKWPKKLFNLSRSYFSNRMASMCGNMLKIQKPVTTVFPQASLSGPGFWNIHYNSLLKQGGFGIYRSSAEFSKYNQTHVLGPTAL